MNDDSGWRITPELSIPWEELEFRATRAGGPGGQHVNTSSTRIELHWNVLASRALSSAQLARLRDKLSTRLSAGGALRVVAASRRSQLQNREEALERLRELVARALVVPKRRVKTRPTRASREARLSGKKTRAGIKRLRGRIRDEE
ncbi:MAG: alternative ribosome rescue aminoacyl-tRNA hydrolase ArfB [Gemmatimonadales bacterium]